MICRMPDGEGHGSVRRVAAGGEGVGRIFGDDPELGHGQAHALAKIADDGRHAAVDFGVLRLAVTGCAA